MGDKVVDWVTAKLPEASVNWAIEYQKILLGIGVAIWAALMFKGMVIGYYPSEVWWMVLVGVVGFVFLFAAEVAKRSAAKSTDNHLDPANQSDEQSS